jgi:hypothetical protein
VPHKRSPNAATVAAECKIDLKAELLNSYAWGGTIAVFITRKGAKRLTREEILDPPGLPAA